MSHKSHKDTRYRAAQRINEVKELISIATTCADFPTATLRHFNDKLLKKIGFFEFSSKELQKYFCFFAPLPENLPEPLALAYHGHQFGVYNPDIGDGRGFLYAQFLDEEDRLLDLGTKGSGQTPFSRSGDGRLTLKGGVREVLATEMLESHGVNTSKSLTLFETGEQLHRGDEPSPARSAVLVRLSHSHIRFGSFQRLAYMENHDGIAELVNYCVRHYHQQAQREIFANTVVEFFRAVVVATADMIASWMAAGFVHGVMNTDNMVITGESFDYGPYRFLPHSDPNFVAAYFDQGGRYRFGRQPDVGLWNLTQLAGCLLSHSTVPELEAVLEEYSHEYRAAFRKHIFRRLGILPVSEEKDGQLLQELLTWLTQTGAGFEQTFFDWQGGPASEARAKNSPQSNFYSKSDFSPLRALLMAQTPIDEGRLEHAYYQADTPVTLLIDDIERLWEHIDKEDDWAPLNRHIEWIRQYRDANS
ncbi:protein adenylyltransferase SelO [Hirschia litorea]|uniref:Protein nucleotidyltransferase YdiU n=1 Tax=Hirschia litorea TaxID=1199156 RepID=A0ABW2IMB9_9PROT